MVSRKIQRSEKKGGNLILGIIAAVCVGILGVTIIYTFSTLNKDVLEIQTLTTDIIVGESIGFNADTDAVHFGKVLPGGTASRIINITHGYDHDVKITLSSEGNISQWIYYDPNVFTLPPSTMQSLKIMIQVPSSAELGYYAGNIYITIRKN